MANLIITEVVGKSYYKVESNDTEFEWDYDFIWPDQIYDVHKNGAVELRFANGKVWELTIDGADGTIEVDSVETITPTDNDHLATLIANLKG